MTIEEITTSAQFVERNKGLPLPAGIRLVGTLPDNMVIITKAELLGSKAGEVHAPAIFLTCKNKEFKPPHPGEIWAVVSCHDLNHDDELVGVVVPTSIYDINSNEGKLMDERDTASSAHGDDRTQFSYLSPTNALMLQKGYWHDRSLVNSSYNPDGYSDPVDQIPA